METTISPETSLIPDSIREIVSEDGAVLLDIEQGVCFSLNPVGLKIWGLLKKHYSVDQIVDTLAYDFEVPMSQLLLDTQEFVALLVDKRLIRRDGQPVRKQPWLKRLVRMCQARNANCSDKS